MSDIGNTLHPEFIKLAQDLLDKGVTTEEIVHAVPRPGGGVVKDTGRRLGIETVQWALAGRSLCDTALNGIELALIALEQRVLRRR